jgi:hypothetical protein
LVLAVNRIGFAAEAPHLEYYLGYSDHESHLKSHLKASLEDLGSFTQSDCPREECRRDYARAVERQRRPLERLRRIREIGEP